MILDRFQSFFIVLYFNLRNTMHGHEDVPSEIVNRSGTRDAARDVSGIDRYHHRANVSSRSTNNHSSFPAYELVIRDCS